SGPPTDQREAFAADVLARPPAAEPGEMSYSNAGFTVAAAMAERVTGERWEDLVRSRIFEPLGMTSAGFGWPGAGGPAPGPSATGPDGSEACPAPRPPAVPYGHWEVDGAYRPQPPNGAYQLGPLIGPAGDLHMNVADLARFARVHLRGIVGEDTIVTAAQI